MQYRRRPPALFYFVDPQIHPGLTRKWGNCASLDKLPSPGMSHAFLRCVRTNQSVCSSRITWPRITIPGPLPSDGNRHPRSKEIKKIKKRTEPPCEEPANIEPPLPRVSNSFLIPHHTPQGHPTCHREETPNIYI